MFSFLRTLSRIKVGQPLIVSDSLFGVTRTWVLGSHHQTTYHIPPTQLQLLDNGTSLAGDERTETKPPGEDVRDATKIVKRRGFISFIRAGARKQAHDSR
ncbi:hypothetical protein NLI96_g6691 [Meripilus lineatus]|uniref:Uncharacterized protein n=1 Tax=Meripilus lineatus TaxID=2056292 RepID=A0AAD5YCR0_9APHY|nr:hypothetical protein NLI96_g6691 [Physisporinus lineatus]